MNRKAIAGGNCVLKGLWNIATDIQRVLLVLLLLIEEWGNVSWSVGILNVYSTGVIMFVLFVVLYKVCMNMKFSLSNVDFLVLAFFVVVFVSGVQSDSSYFTHRALLSWAVIGASYYVSRMSDSKQAATWLETLFCITLCSRILYCLKQFISGTTEPGITLSVCTFICVCVSPWLIIRANSRWEKLFYMVGTLILALGLSVMFMKAIVVLVFILFLQVPYVRFKKIRHVITIVLATAFIILVVAYIDYDLVANRMDRVRVFWGNGPGFYMSLQDPCVSNGNVKTLAHSVYEVVFCEFGVPGLCLFSLVGFVAFWQCVLQENFGIAVAILALSISLFDVPYRDALLIVLSVFMGMGGAYSTRTDRMIVSEKGRPFSVKLVIVVLIGILIVQYVTYQVKEIQAQGYVLSGERLRNAGLFSQALENYRRAAILVLENPVACVLLGETFLTMDMHAEAALLFERALEYGSRSRSTYVGLAKAYSRLDRRILALRILQEGTLFHSDIDSEVIFGLKKEESLNASAGQLKLSEIGYLEYEKGVISFEVLMENQGPNPVDVIVFAKVLGFEEKVYWSIGLGSMVIKAKSGCILQKSIDISLPQGIYMLKILTRYGDATLESIGYFVMS